MARPGAGAGRRQGWPRRAEALSRASCLTRILYYERFEKFVHDFLFPFFPFFLTHDSADCFLCIYECTTPVISSSSMTDPGRMMRSHPIASRAVKPCDRISHSAMSVPVRHRRQYSVRLI